MDIDLSKHFNKDNLEFSESEILNAMEKLGYELNIGDKYKGYLRDTLMNEENLTVEEYELQKDELVD